VNRVLPLVIAAVGILPAFFAAFLAVFADAISFNDKLLAVLYVAAVYAILGAIAGAVLKSWWGGVWLAGAGVLIVVLYTIGEYTRLDYHAIVVVTTIAAACLGAEAGARVREQLVNFKKESRGN
jgi:hypothetical protein